MPLLMRMRCLTRLENWLTAPRTLSIASLPTGGLGRKAPNPVTKAPLVCIGRPPHNRIMRNVEKSQSDSVVIVGAGPTGCTLALLLARAGIQVTLIEQNAEPQQHPAACILNTRTMEIFRQIGIEEQIRDACQNIFERGLICWVVSLAGRELGRCSALPDNLENILALSPTHTVQYPQHMLEPMLWRSVERQPGINFKKGYRLVSIQHDRNGVTAILTE